MGTLGKTSVVLAERIHEAVGPREKYGPNPIVSSLAAQVQPKAVSNARGVVDLMMYKAERKNPIVPVRLLKRMRVNYREEGDSVGKIAKPRCCRAHLF